MTTETETNEPATAETNVEAPKSSENKAGAKLSYEELDQYHERAIKDNVKYRDTIKDLKARLKELEPQASRMAELEEQIPQIEAKAREKVTRAEFWALLKADGVADRDVLKLLDTSAVEFDDEGEPKNVAEIYTSFKEAKAYLFGNSKPAETKATSVHKAPAQKATEIDWMTATAEEIARARKPSRL